MKTLRNLLFVVLSLAAAQHAMAGVVVVVGNSSPLASATADDVKKLFLAKASNISGHSLTPIDQSSGNAARDGFYDAVVGMNGSQLKAYWSKLVFTGKGQPPSEVGGDADVISAVAGDASLIGYVDSGAVTGDVKVVLEVN